MKSTERAEKMADKIHKLSMKLMKLLDAKDKYKLKNLLMERKKLMDRKEQEKIDRHNKYLPKYLSVKILNAVGFIEFTRQQGKLDMHHMTKFLMEEKKFTHKEISWVLLLLSLETVEEILSTPEIGGLIKDAITKNKQTIH